MKTTLLKHFLKNCFYSYSVKTKNRASLVFICKKKAKIFNFILKFKKLPF